MPNPHFLHEIELRRLQGISLKVNLTVIDNLDDVRYLIQVWSGQASNSSRVAASQEQLVRFPHHHLCTLINSITCWLDSANSLLLTVFKDFIHLCIMFSVFLWWWKWKTKIWKIRNEEGEEQLRGKWREIVCLEGLWGETVAVKAL